MNETAGSTTRPGAPLPDLASGPTAPAPAVPTPPAAPCVIGEVVLVRLDTDVVRPMIVSSCEVIQVSSPQLPVEEQRHEFRASGTIFCTPSDHATQAVRRLEISSLYDPMRIHGRPDRYLALAYGEHLREGDGIGEWRGAPSPALRALLNQPLPLPRTPRRSR